MNSLGSRSQGTGSTLPSLELRSSLILFLVLCGCGRSLDTESTADFQRAQQAFDAAKSPTDFLLAASLFQKVVDRGVKSGVVFYNQGNAYMRGEQRGRAIACYRQAKRYRPRDPQLDANLQFALGNPPQNSSRPLMEYVFFWQDWLSYPAKFQLSILSAAVTLVLALAGLFMKSSVARRIAGLFLVVTFVLCCSAIYDWDRFAPMRHGVVTSPSVVARKGNAESYEPAFTSALSEGTEFTVVEQRGDWLLVKLLAGQEGWLKQTDVVTY